MQPHRPIEGGWRGKVGVSSQSFACPGTLPLVMTGCCLHHVALTAASCGRAEDCRYHLLFDRDVIPTEVSSCVSVRMYAHRWFEYMLADRRTRPKRKTTSRQRVRGVSQPSLPVLAALAGKGQVQVRLHVRVEVRVLVESVLLPGTSPARASCRQLQGRFGYDRHLFVLPLVVQTTRIQGPPCSSAVSTASLGIPLDRSYLFRSSCPFCKPTARQPNGDISMAGIVTTHKPISLTQAARPSAVRIPPCGPVWKATGGPGFTCSRSIPRAHSTRGVGILGRA